jgi:DNA-binding protein H-NS
MSGMSYRELLAQHAEIEKQIQQARNVERKAAIEQINTLMAEFDINPQEIGRKRAPSSLRPVPAKYRDPQSGATWSGRGKPPFWIKDQERTAFLIDRAE